MVELFYAYWPVVLVALAIGIIVGFLVFRPRQRVRLTDSAPVRPHMTIPPGETVLEHEAEVTTRHVSGSEGPVPAQLSDELERLKGVGPKLASMLKARGLTRYEQLAKLTDEELERLDAGLGAFQGRLQRDRVVEQADYLARGDIDGFEQKFGKV
jgi:predicted flap endonuclease-1-like 5' DNA nuclease